VSDESPGPVCEDCGYTAAQCTRARFSGHAACCPDCGSNHRQAVAVFLGAINLADLVRIHSPSSPQQDTP
jgi:anaerobic ribonucleoside-triphosphate reductase